jgi:hypothetical protein
MYLNTVVKQPFVPQNSPPEAGPRLFDEQSPETTIPENRDNIPKYNRIFLTQQIFGNIVPKYLV